MMSGLEVVGPGQKHPGESARGDVAAFGVCASLADVLAQEVVTAREAESFDLLEEVLDRNGRFLGPASAQVLAVGADEAGAVFRDAEHPFWPVGRA
jgi:cysteine synthase